MRAFPVHSNALGPSYPRLASYSALYESSIWAISAVTISPLVTISCPALT